MPEDLSNLPYVERKIREAMERGEFDDLPGSGKPLQDLNDDPMWWVKKWIKREQVREAMREERERKERS